MPHEERMLKGAFHQHGKASFSNLNNTARRTGYSQTPYMKKSVPDMGNIYQTNHEVSALVKRHGKDSINAMYHSIPTIMESPLWQEIQEWKLDTCNTWCGTMEPRPVVTPTML